MKGSEFVDKLKLEFKCETDKELADVLGRSIPSISSWRKKSSISPMVAARAMRELAERVEGETESLREKLREKQVSHSISAILEYAPIAAYHKSTSKTAQIKSSDGFGYLRIRDKLENKRGIYIFYSSLARAIYVGKAKDTELWTEANSAFNREFKGDLCKVNYPNENQKMPSNMKLSRHTAKVYEVATYFLAYEVDVALVDKVEALMIRSFINELSNVKIENLIDIRKTEV
jgi:hypothetical protein